MKKYQSRAGFTLVEIMIVVAIIGLLAAIAIPNFLKARTSSQSSACLSNLRIIDSAKQQWAMDSKKVSTDTPSPTQLMAYIGHGTATALPACPAGGAYTIGTVATAPTCSKNDGTNHIAVLAN